MLGGVNVGGLGGICDECDELWFRGRGEVREGEVRVVWVSLGSWGRVVSLDLGELGFGV